MGQATLESSADLPDPLDLPTVDPANATPVSAAALASADDLLSQLAGEDIDRLLAEAESANAAEVAAMPAPVDAAVVNEAAVAVASEAVLVQQSPVEPVADLREQLQADPAPVESAAVVNSQEAAALQVMMETPAALPQVAVESVVQPVVQTLDVEDPAAVAAALRGGEEHPRRASVLVKALQVVNSPMAWISDAVRDALGKIALLTLFNAVAVLVYVLVFRRHGR